jgi:exopolysaccharide biosynthesis polyprenyl glycosylphosphotransferase
MALVGAYDRRILATGADQYRRIANAGMWLFCVVASTSYLAHADISRAAVGLAIPAVTLLCLVAHWITRRLFRRKLLRGRALNRVVVLGTRTEVRDVIRHMHRAPHAGFRVVAACISDHDPAQPGFGGMPVNALGTTEDVLATVAQTGADTIAVAGTASLADGALRRLSWELEGTGTGLMVVPAIADVAGPRIVVRPVEGLPLLHVEEPEHAGPQRLFKDCVDAVVAGLTTVLVAPLLVLIAAAIKLDSRGPVLFKQLRVGKHGRPFTMFKFRTMRQGAEAEIAELAHLNQQDGPLFKIREDPRVTRVGRMLRRYSLDELPQLLNVVSGKMSLVGPRPPLPSEVEAYDGAVRRRLLVRPGITGLWQVSGRADLTWDEAVRLDLFYVDNWSITLDCLLVWRTLAAVVARRGAY